MGKVSRAFFENVIARHLGEKRRDVVVGPANGVDVGVVRLPDGRALISTTDPIYIVPQYGWERAAWFAFHILASDLTTSGVAPQYVTMDWNLPMDIEDEQIETMLRITDRECRKYGAAIVTGHTGRYEGCAYPMVGGATFLAIAPKDGWVTADMAKPGNRLLVTKTAALEATAILSNTFPELVHRRLGEDIAMRARALFDSISTGEDALAAPSVGRRGDAVRALDGATEVRVRQAAWQNLGAAWAACTWSRPRSCPSRGCWQSSKPASKAAHRSCSFATRRSSHRKRGSRPPGDFGRSATGTPCRSS